MPYIYIIIPYNIYHTIIVSYDIIFVECLSTAESPILFLYHPRVGLMNLDIALEVG
jgi:hypothetical protein